MKSTHSHRIQATAALILAGILLLSAQSGHSAALQPISTISEAARRHVTLQLQEPSAQVRVGALDRRLRLSRCGKPLETFSPPGRQNPARRTVGVRCTAPSPWTIFVPVEVRLPKQVLVATRSLAKGTILTADDLKTEQRDVARMTRGYLSSLQAAEGKRLKRPVTANRALSPDMVETPDAIVRGARVTIVASSGGLQVRMAGEALSAGAKGERIRVKNSHSKREIEATVLGPGLVGVTL